ncbi:hypothetical protein, partial [Methylobacterium trifolii]|uniref:hypothetical protein n=1 Tax=Methylobacterium trifolii TaxID=1003092 RepID=UPI001EDCADBE
MGFGGMVEARPAAASAEKSPWPVVVTVVEVSQIANPETEMLDGDRRDDVQADQDQQADDGRPETIAQVPPDAAPEPHGPHSRSLRARQVNAYGVSDGVPNLPRSAGSTTTLSGVSNPCSRMSRNSPSTTFCEVTAAVMPPTRW